MIACVTVDVEHRAVDQTFDYLVPDNLEEAIEVGQRVRIPFGHRTITGIVVDTQTTSAIEKLKPILGIVDIEPLFTPEHLDLSETLSNDYLTPRMRYLNAMLPGALRMRYTRKLVLKDKASLPQALHHRFANKTTIPVDAELSRHPALIKRAVREGAIDIVTEPRQKHGKKRIPYVVLNDASPLTGSKQQAVIDYLVQRGRVAKKTVLDATGASHDTIRRLQARGAISVENEEVYRDAVNRIEVADVNHVLTSAQTVAVEAVESAFGRAATFLLHGITSSGKTEVYMRLTERVLARGESVLMLVPEIALTPLLVARFKARFHEQVAIYHSRLSLGEQYDEWRRVKRGEATILIGARSAVFTPMNNLGLILIDEEHSDTYKQEDSPPYHAKDVAFWRANRHQTPVVLGSATPSIESYYRSEQGDITRLRLPERVGESRLPTVDIVDMKREFAQGNRTFFSTPLHEAMQATHNRGEQTLLLINRRGHANFILCRACGHTVRCDDCDVSMTYHRHDQTLKCHYCDANKAVPTVCPACHSPHIRYMGLGSERVEATLKTVFPTAKVYRMDRDTTSQKDGHAAVLDAFENDGDFLVGTQMISKGLDFDNVTLVGILSADMALFVPDFRAREETFALLTQMAGRSGRRQTPGRVIVQAYDHDHPVLDYVKNHEYRRFYDHEIVARAHADVSPFRDMLAVTVTHAEASRVFHRAADLTGRLRRQLSDDARVIGPIRPAIGKTHGKHRMHVLVKHHKEPALMQTIKAWADALDSHDVSFIIDRQPGLL